MTKRWYPDRVNVGPEGTPGTYNFLTECFDTEAHFSYAELGIYRADTARAICERFPHATLYLFDFHEAVDAARKKLSTYPNRIYYFGNSQRYNDSYNWSLLRLIKSNDGNPLFDYVFLDGAHTFAVDGLSFFLCDMLLKPNGYLDFDDYNWRLRGSSLDPEKVPEIALQYTNEQIEEYQVQLIINELVRRSEDYEEVVKNKIFRKV